MHAIKSCTVENRESRNKTAHLKVKEMCQFELRTEEMKMSMLVSLHIHNCNICLQHQFQATF